MHLNRILQKVVAKSILEKMSEKSNIIKIETMKSPEGVTALIIVFEAVKKQKASDGKIISTAMPMHTLN